MRILIISDSHGNVANLKAVMEIAKKSGFKSVIHCGDWDNTESVDLVSKYGIPLYSVLGNADSDPAVGERLIESANGFSENFLKFEIGGRKIGLIHNLKFLPRSQLSGLDIIFSGHYHSKEQKIVDFRKYIRPGSLVNGLNFAVYETETGEVDFIEENTA